MFEITGTLADQEWARARARREEHLPGSSYDVSRTPLYQLLYGDLDIRTDEGELYGEGRVNISLLDFAIFADWIVRDDCSAEAPFDQLDDDRHIRFDFSTPRVRISADDSENLLIAPRDEVSSGLRQFLVSLAHEIDTRAPRVFDWRSIEPLAAYRSAWPFTALPSG